MFVLWMEDAASVLDLPNEADVLPTSSAFARALSQKPQILYGQIPMGIMSRPMGWPVDIDSEKVFKENCNENNS